MKKTKLERMYGDVIVQDVELLTDIFTQSAAIRESLRSIIE